MCEAEDNVDWEEDDSIYVEPKCRDKQRSSPFEGLILQFPLVAHPIKRLNKAAYLVCVMCALTCLQQKACLTHPIYIGHYKKLKLLIRR